MENQSKLEEFIWKEGSSYEDW